MTLYCVSIHNPFNGLSIPFKVPDTSHPLWMDPDQSPPHILRLFASEAEARAFCAGRDNDPGFRGTGLHFVYAPATETQLNEPRESERVRAGRQHEAKARVAKVMQKRPRR